MKLVYVEWVDSETDQGWRVIDRYAESVTNLSCITVGFLVRECEAFISVAGTKSIDPSGNPHAVCDPISIPWGAITKFQEIVF